MASKMDCISALQSSGLFENNGHHSRFKELMNCFSSYPFFSKGICKCMYLSAWDEEHFCIILEVLTALSLGKDINALDMRIQGDALAEQETTDESYIYHLANAFLDDQPFSYDSDADIDPSIKYIIEQALKAAEVIDDVI